MSDTTTTPTAAEEETAAFLEDLEKRGEEMKYAWMSARVPASMREAFDAEFPPPTTEPAPPPPVEPAPPAEPTP